MEVNTIAELIGNYGMAFVLMAYFLVKDWTQTSAIIETLNAIQQTLVELRTWHAKEE